MQQNRLHCVLDAFAKIDDYCAKAAVHEAGHALIMRRNGGRNVRCHVNLGGKHSDEQPANDDGWQWKIAADYATNHRTPQEQMARAIANDYAAMAEEQAAGFPAECGIANNGNWFIDTRITRKSRYSNNGGDYSYWTEYWHAGGRTYRLERASCDFWQPEDEPWVVDGEIEFRR